MAIIRLSKPGDTHMSQEWFNMADPDHFWLQHKYRLVCQHFQEEFTTAQTIAEIGCGNGIFIELLSQHFKKTIDGIELSETIINQCHTTAGSLFLYDIAERNPLLRERYDLLYGFDILEHIEREKRFLQNLWWHLQPHGLVLFNVPTRSSLYSAYDQALGHFRRYDAALLFAQLEHSGFKIKKYLHWGYVYLPLLYCRTMLMKLLPLEKVVEAGFKTNPLTNVLLKILSRLDWTTQWNIHGTSLLVLAEKV